MPPEFLKKPPKLGSGPTRKPNVLEPSFMRDLFQGIVDIPMGALGVGPDSKANRLGAMLGMMIPTSKLAMGRYGKPNLKFPTQSRLGMGMSPTNGIYDDAGRYLGTAKKADSVFDAHVASSVGKGDPRMVTKIEPVEEAFVNKGINKGLTPSDDQYEKLLKKHGGRK